MLLAYPYLYNQEKPGFAQNTVSEISAPPSSSSSLDMLVGLIFTNVWHISRSVTIEQIDVKQFLKVICFTSQRHISIFKLPFGMVYTNCVFFIDFHFKFLRQVGGF